MRYIKKLNEFFDDDDLKSSMEIDYISKKIPFKEIIKDKNIIKQKDLLLSKLLMNCPFISNLGYNRNGKLLTLGHSNKIVFSDTDNVTISFYIEIIENKSTESYTCNVQAICIGNDHKLFNESIIKGIMTYDKLVNLLNLNVLNLLIEFNKFTKRNFSYEIVKFNNRKDVMNNLNIRNN